MQFKKFTLDPFQEEAINAIGQNCSVVVSAPTGSGKTLIADYIIEQHRDDSKRIMYTAPIKALSNQKYKDFCREYGDQAVGLMTGDLVINPSAKIIVMTTEIYRNMAVSQDSDLSNVAYVIFDEIHYINDIERGYVWEESIIYSASSVRFLCLSATIPNAKEFSNWISAIKKHSVKTVVSTKRNVPLDHAFFDYELGITTLEKIKAAKEIPKYHSVIGGRRGGKAKKARGGREKTPEPNHIDLISELGVGKLPCIFFSFSRKDCQIKAEELCKAKLFEPNAAILTQFNEKLREAPVDIMKLKSVQLIKQVISQGIAFHHAGLLPIIKEAVEELFGKGLIKVLYATETFAVGINMPAKTVCFDGLRKFDGFNFRPLNTKEYFQIAGRAGRRGIDTQGYVVSMLYRPTFNIDEVRAITTKDTEPIKSQFRLCVNTVLNLIHMHTPADIEHILRLSFFSYQKFGEKYDSVPTTVLLARYNSIVRQLTKYGYVEKGKLTTKGVFASQIFADEIAIGEVFATEFWQNLNEYQILLVLGSLAYEYRENNKFEKVNHIAEFGVLRRKLVQDDYLSHEKKFLNMETMDSLISPLCAGKNFFDILKNTNLLEGDLIRIMTQILDRLGQVKKATSDYTLRNKIVNCKGVIEKALEGIYLVG